MVTPGVRVQDGLQNPTPVFAVSPSSIGIIGDTTGGSVADEVVTRVDYDNYEQLFGVGSGASRLIEDIMDASGERPPMVVVGYTTTSEGDWKSAASEMRRSESATGIHPSIIITDIDSWNLDLTDNPLSTEHFVATEFNSMTNEMGNIAVIQAAPTSVTLAKSWRVNNTSDNVIAVWPRESETPNHNVVGYVAGTLIELDTRIGVSANPMYQPIKGVGALEHQVSFGSQTSEASELAADGVMTIINHDGRRLWGNKMADGTTFISVQRIKNKIRKYLEDRHYDALSRNIDQGFFDYVTGRVNNYLISLIESREIRSGLCTADMSQNTDANLSQGDAYYNVVIESIRPVVRITFQFNITP